MSASLRGVVRRLDNPAQLRKQHLFAAALPLQIDQNRPNGQGVFTRFISPQHKARLFPLVNGAKGWYRG